MATMAVDADALPRCSSRRGIRGRCEQHDRCNADTTVVARRMLNELMHSYII